ncbi:MAG: hypothetical protein AVDCRST_MAG50-994 [uncultured Acidimicrobiales bacterium]|uniref:Uncharacterized protein n=1 Tax=uncultured Acidimicrobiales bacterium TaxID=310071 RepID=A0A6J4GZG4_9ACTN|nr:MAG: hypothetical protein AVDCRST_MAG50-994 [uncultured Acidimicrobiales bacterium]
MRKRERIRSLVSLGKRAGYGLFAIAIAVFFWGFATGFEDWMVTLVAATMAVGSALLAPAIVFGYGIGAAERDERERPITRR